MDLVLYALGSLAALVGVGWATSVRVVQQIERGVVFRLGRAQQELRRPGLTMLIPVVDRMKRVNMQVVTMPVPAQDGITRDNVTVRVDAVVYFKVTDPVRRTLVGEAPRTRRSSWTSCCTRWDRWPSWSRRAG